VIEVRNLTIEVRDLTIEIIRQKTETRTAEVTFKRHQTVVTVS
jgi:hypothetical protein